MKVRKPARGGLSVSIRRFGDAPIDWLAGQKVCQHKRLHHIYMITWHILSGHNPKFGCFGDRTNVVSLAFHLDDAVVRHGLQGAR